MVADSTVLLVVAAAYLAIVLGVSIWGYRHTKTEEDFLAAGRTIGPWVGGAVLAATQISAGTFVGTLGRHYLTGVSWTWIWFGVWAGWAVSAVFVAPKLRRFGALTVADYVGTRFASEGARTLAAALIIVTYTILLTAQFQAIGEIASAVFGVAPMVAMAALLASTGFYTALGGVRSSSYIEFVQTLIMVLALRAARCRSCSSHVGGVDGARRVRGLDRAARHRLVVLVEGAAGVRPGVRPRHRRRALRDDALLLDARRGDGALRDRHLDAAAGAHRFVRDDARHRHARRVPVPAVGRTRRRASWRPR